MANTPFDIKSLYTNFRDMSRSNLFYVEIKTISKGQGGGDTTDSNTKYDMVKFLCKAAQVPTLTAGGAVEVPIMNRKYKLSGDPTFDDISLTIMNDQDYVARKYFEEWFSIIHNIFKTPNDATSGGDTKIVSGEAWDYMREVTLHRLDRKMQPIMDVSLHYAFPTSVDSIDLGWENNDQIDEFTVNLSFTYPEFNYNPTQNSTP